MCFILKITPTYYKPKIPSSWGKFFDSHIDKNHYLNVFNSFFFGIRFILYIFIP